MKRLVLGTALLTLTVTGPVRAQEKFPIIRVTAGKHGYKNVPVCVPLSVPSEWATQDLVGLRPPGEGQTLFGQLTAPGLLHEHVKPATAKRVRRDLHFVIPSLAPGATATWQVGWNVVSRKPPGFAWKDTKGEYADLVYEASPVMRYWYKAYDGSTPESRDRTYKVFHHLFDPAGKRIVTNGGQADLAAGETKKLLYPHHRGLMFAYNNITYGEGKKADTWHAKPGDTHQAHASFKIVEGGPVLGRHRVLVDWHGPKDEVFAREERELTVYNVPGGTLVQFVTRLKTAGGPVKLDGDPQHAGFQFRAHNDVSQKTAKQTYYLRPDGKGEPGETRNWDPKTKKGPINLPWDAMSFVLDGKRYTAAYLNHPSNPGESRWSERDYGRFGCYFPYELTEDRPLTATYRVWLQDGEMTGPQVEALHTNFVSPPGVTVR